MENHDILDNNFNGGGNEPLPNAGTVHTLGIISIVTGCLCSIIGAILGIIALVMYGNVKNTYLANPERYNQAEFTKANNGRIMAIIGMVIGFLMFIISITMQIIGGLAEYSNFN